MFGLLSSYRQVPGPYSFETKQIQGDPSDKENSQQSVERSSLGYLIGGVAI